MFWKKDNQHYEICIPPIDKNTCELTHNEAQAYFDWYMSVIPRRIAYLCAKCAGQTNRPIGDFQCTPDSLLPLWEWFLNVARTEKRDADHTIRFTLQTEYIMRDIGMYLGEVFVKQNPVISWNYFETPKSDFFVNTPVLMGFEDAKYMPVFHPAFEPIHMVRVQASKLLKGNASPNDLRSLYDTWQRMVPRKPSDRSD